MARSQNPMEAFRREQKKKELKKHKHQRQQDKKSKLADMDPDEIRDTLKKLERQLQSNPTDGPTRKRKQELEDTLNAVVKKHKAMEEEQKQQEAAKRGPTTLSDLNAANRERYQNPENSIYYHPVLNPFGAPPPGHPQKYRVPPPVPTSVPRAPPADKPTRSTGRAHKRVGSVSGSSTQRPGKRPPLPSGPPPSGCIQVPRRPPLPQGAVPYRPPPPPPPGARVAPPPPAPSGYPVPPPPAAVVAQPSHGYVVPPPPSSSVVDYPMDEDAVAVAPYPPSDDAVMPHNYQQDEMDDEERAEQQARVRSLVPTALRKPARPTQPERRVTPPPRPLAPAPAPASAPGPRLMPVAAPAASPASASTEFDAFMQEMKGLGALE